MIIVQLDKAENSVGEEGAAEGLLWLRTGGAS